MRIKRMTTKQFALGALIVVSIGIIVETVRHNNSIEYVAPVATTTVEHVEVLPEWAQDEDAVKAAQDVLRKKELEAELESLTVEREAIQERINKVEKELGSY